MHCAAASRRGDDRAHSARARFPRRHRRVDARYWPRPAWQAGPRRRLEARRSTASARPSVRSNRGHRASVSGWRAFRCGLRAAGSRPPPRAWAADRHQDRSPRSTPGSRPGRRHSRRTRQKALRRSAPVRSPAATPAWRQGSRARPSVPPAPSRGQDRASRRDKSRSGAAWRCGRAERTRHRGGGRRPALLRTPLPRGPRDATPRHRCRSSGRSGPMPLRGHASPKPWARRHPSESGSARPSRHGPR